MSCSQILYSKFNILNLYKICNVQHLLTDCSVSFLHISQLLCKLVHFVLIPLWEGEVDDPLEVLGLHLAVGVLLDQLRVVLRHYLHVQQRRVLCDVLEILRI